MSQHPDNAKRGERAKAALQAHQYHIGEWDSDNVRDPLTDLRHYCDTQDVDFDNEDLIAYAHYQDELQDPTL